MTLATALAFDAGLSATPLYADVGGQLIHAPERDRFVREWAERHGVEPGPCERDCLHADRLRHPELADHVFCARCPMARANPPEGAR